ncbi:Amino acid transporter AVT6C [Bienertia sinuspersici]
MGDVTGEFMLRYTHSGKSTTYAGLMGESFGRLGSLALQICVMITSFGCLIIYLIIIGDVLSGTKAGTTIHTGLLQEWFGFYWWTSRAFAILFVVLLVILPLVLFRRVDSLRYTSLLAILLAMVFIVISSIMAVEAMMEGEHAT